MGEPGEVEAVVAGVVLQAGGLHAPEALLDVAGGVLDGLDAGVLGQARQGVLGDLHAGAPGDVVDHDGQVGGLDDGVDVPVDPLLAGAVVVGGVDEQSLGTGLLGGHTDAHRVGGVVGAGTGHDHGTSGQSVLDLADQLLLLGGVGGRGLTGGARQEDQVGAVVDQADRQGAGGVKVDLPAGREGGDHGDADGTEAAGEGCAHGANPNARPAHRGSVLMICCIGTYIPSCAQGPGRPVT